MDNKILEYLKEQLDNDNNSIVIVYPNKNTEDAAIELSNRIDCAIGAVKYYDDQKEEDEGRWGVLIDLTKGIAEIRSGHGIL